MKIFIPILMALLVMAFASAATVVNLDPAGNLANQTYQTSSTITYGINVTGNQSNWECDLYTTENGSTGQGAMTKVVTDYPVSNATNTNFVARANVADGTGATNYTWMVHCDGTTDPVGAFNLVNNTFGVDATAPVIAITTPTVGYWDTDGNLTFTLNATDTNAATCLLGTTMDFAQDSNSSTGVWNGTSDTNDYTTATPFTYTGMNNNIMVDNGTGAYIYAITCNDSAGNSATSGNRTVYVDTVAPAAFSFLTADWKTDNVVLWNGTTATDYTPQIGYQSSVELNFSRYEIVYYNVSGPGVTVRLNDTTQGSQAANRTINITTLTGDASYRINITAYDLAGNSVTMTTNGIYQYSTDSTNRALKAGWNLVGNVGNNLTLSQLLTYSGATTASFWNSSHEFQSHVSGGSFGSTVVKGGEVALLYMGADSNFEDLVWNATNVGITQFITNSSDSGANSAWNLVMNKNSSADVTMGATDNFANCNPVIAGCGNTEQNATNVDYMSFYDNTANDGSKYIPLVANWTINNGTTLTYGDPIWMYVDQNITLNWGLI